MKTKEQVLAIFNKMSEELFARGIESGVDTYVEGDVWSVSIRASQREEGELGRWSLWERCEWMHHSHWNKGRELAASKELKAFKAKLGLK